MQDAPRLSTENADQVRVRSLIIGIDGRIPYGLFGGVESVVRGLVGGLSALTDGDERYRVLTYPGQDDWLRPHVGGAVEVLHVRSASRLRARLARKLPAVARAWRRLRPHRMSIEPPLSDGSIEAAGVQVMHFTHQAGFLTATPSIYHPHDLQHLHLPEFFTPEQIARREAWYRGLADQATIVAVASTWVKRDLEDKYGLDPAKVKVIPFAPPTRAFATLDAPTVKSRLRRMGILPGYILYAAQTWPHKNHLGLLQALSAVRAGGLDVRLVAPGHQTEFMSTLLDAQQTLGVADLVTWPGFVEPDDLLALYGGATAVVVPSRFEAASAPMWEAFDAGVPVASSNVTSLPEQAGDAALLFDPNDTPAIANAIRRLWTEPELRERLVARGHARVAGLSWDRSARIFRAYYRRIAGRNLSEDDRLLVNADAPF